MGTAAVGAVFPERSSQCEPSICDQSNVRRMSLSDGKRLLQERDRGGCAALCEPHLAETIQRLTQRLVIGAEFIVDRFQRGFELGASLCISAKAPSRNATTVPSSRQTLATTRGPYADLRASGKWIAGREAPLLRFWGRRPAWQDA